MKDHFHKMSHSGLLALAFKQNRSSEAQAYAGGNFDMAKLEGYKTELRIRLGFTSVLPGVIEHIAVKLAERPAGTLHPPLSGYPHEIPASPPASPS